MNARLAAAVAVLLAVLPEARAATVQPGFPARAPALVSSPLLLADLEGDGERIIGAAGNQLFCVRTDGKKCEGFPLDLPDKASVVGAPAAGDLDGDKRLEIVLALSTGRLLALRSDGSPFPALVFKADGFQSGPTLFDVDGKGKAELIVGTRDGKLHVLGADGVEQAGFPVSFGGAITSPPSLGLLGTPARLCIAVGTEDGKLNVVDAKGAPVPGFPVATQYIVSGQPAFGDLDGDGANDLAFTSQDFRIYAVRGDGTAFAGFPSQTGARLLAGPALADLDGDGVLEIFAGSIDGRVHGVRLDGKPLPGFPAKVGEKIVGAVVVADLDRDGKDEILAATADGALHALKLNGKPFAGFPGKTAGEPNAGPVVSSDGVAGGDNLALFLGAGDKISGFRVKRVGKVSSPLSWPVAGHDAGRSGRRFPNPSGYAELRVEPSGAGTDDVLHAAYRFFDLDGDPEPTTGIRWFRDGKEIPELAGKRDVPRESTKKHEKWKFEAKAPDGAGVMSPEITLANSKPGLAKLALEPAGPRRSEAVKVKIVEDAPDPDGDKPSYRYAWLKDGKLQKGLDQASLPAGTVKRGERWTAVVEASDGEGTGAAASVEAFGADSPPSMPEVTLTPANPKTGDAIKAEIKKESIDADGDKVRYQYRFSIDGVAVHLAAALDTLPPFLARKKQVVAVEVRGDDGELLGAPGTAQTTIVNTPPGAPAPAISPLVARRMDTLTAGLKTPSTDADGDRLSYRFTFRRDGKKLPGESVTGLKRGETYELEAIANDGEADSAPAVSKLTVVNSRPDAAAISFAGEGFKAGEAVALKIDAPGVDADGDVASYEYAWLVNGKPSGLGKGDSAIPAGRTRKGELWTVEVTSRDGEEAGKTARTQLTVVNTLPTAPEIALEPQSPRANEAIKVVVKKESKDSDGDKLKYRYRFFVDGAPVAQPETQDTLPAMSAHKKQVVSVEVRADDGEGLGAPATDKVTVANTAPEAPRVTLLPAKPKGGDTLAAAITAPAADLDLDRLTYRFTFLRDGKKVERTEREQPLVGGETWELEVVANDGEADSVVARAKVSVENGKPSAPTVAFSNAAPRAGEAVEVKLVRPALDPDGETVSYEYVYSVGGKPAGLGKTDAAIPSGRLKKHEAWTVEVTPRDGKEAGPTARAQLTVLNTPPEPPRVSIDPPEPTALTGAKARLDAPATDKDGDTLKYRYTWLRDGVKLDQPAETASLAPGTLHRGESLRLIVTAFDGEAESAPVIATAKVKNSSPVAAELVIAPAKPTVKDALSCGIKMPARDPDGEALTLGFAWFRDGQRLPTSAEQDKLPAGTARHGESWTCQVTASDGELAAAASSSPAKIENTAPLAPVVVVEPENPRAGQDLFCRIGKPSEDADADAVTYAFSWTVAGKPATGDPAEPFRLAAGLLKKGQPARCEVTASDATAKGGVASAERQLKNSPPGRARVRVTPEGPAPGATLACEVVEPAVDPDGDAVRYRFLWTRNGAEQTFAQSSAEVPGRLVKPEETWRCAVVPGDGELDGLRSESLEVTVSKAKESASRQR